MKFHLPLLRWSFLRSQNTGWPEDHPSGKCSDFFFKNQRKTQSPMDPTSIYRKKHMCVLMKETKKTFWGKKQQQLQIPMGSQNFASCGDSVQPMGFDWIKKTRRTWTFFSSKESTSALTQTWEPPSGQAGQCLERSLVGASLGPQAKRSTPPTNSWE